MYQVVVVTGLRPKDGRFQQAPIASAVDTTEFLDEAVVNFKSFGHCKLKKRRHLFRE
jgi:hypothetical protein